MKVYKKILLICFMMALVTTLGSAVAEAKMKIAVVEFQNNASGGSGETRAVTRAVTDMLTTELFKTGAFDIYERSRLEAVAQEQQMSSSGVLNAGTAVSIGQLVGVQAVVTGAITEFTFKQSGGGIPIAGMIIAVGESKAFVSLDLRVIDVQTGEVKMVIREKGSASHSIGGVGGQYGVFAQSENGGILSAATYNCVQKVAQKMRQMVHGSAYKVLSASSSCVTVNAGSSQGIQPGQLLAVYFESNPITDMDGSIIGIDKEYLAVLKAADVQGAYCKCEVVRGKGARLRRGDNVELMFKKTDDVNITKHSRALGALSDSSAGKSNVVSGRSAKPSPSVAVAEKKTQFTSQPQQTVAPSCGIANTSAQLDVVDTYSIDSKTKNSIKIAHRGGYYSYSHKQYKKAYRSFVSSFNLYKGNYLDSYWASRAAYKAGYRSKAKEWVKTTLEINSDYEPAKDFKKKHRL